MITVVGKLKDTKKYVGLAGYNVLANCENWTPKLNQKFINEAIERGDEILFVSWSVNGQYKNELLQMLYRLLNK